MNLKQTIEYHFDLYQYILIKLCLYLIITILCLL
jgi:hypothetical protein